MGSCSANGFIEYDEKFLRQNMTKEFVETIRFSDEGKGVLRYVFFAGSIPQIRTNGHLIRMHDVRRSNQKEKLICSYMLKKMEKAYKKDVVGLLVKKHFDEGYFVTKAFQKYDEDKNKVSKNEEAFYNHFCKTLDVGTKMDEKDKLSRYIEKSNIKEENEEKRKYTMNPRLFCQESYYLYLKKHNIPEWFLPVCSYWPYHYYNKNLRHSFDKDCVMSRKQLPAIYESDRRDSNLEYKSFEEIIDTQERIPKEINRYIFNQYTPIYDIFFYYNYMLEDSDYEEWLDDKISNMKRKLRNIGKKNRSIKQTVTQEITKELVERIWLPELKTTHFKYCICRLRKMKSITFKFRGDVETLKIQQILCEPIDELYNKIKAMNTEEMFEDLYYIYEDMTVGEENYKLNFSNDDVFDAVCEYVKANHQLQ